MAGRNTSWPVELAAENTPMTTPRCRRNHRFATIAPKTSASEPVPMPTAKPHSSHSCQAELIARVRPEPDRHEGKGRRRHAPDAEALHQRSGERRGQAVDHQVQADRARGGGPGPAELALQRLQERAGRGPEGRRGDQCAHGDRGDPPRPVDGAASGGQGRGHRHMLGAGRGGDHAVSPEGRDVPRVGAAAAADDPQGRQRPLEPTVCRGECGRVAVVELFRLVQLLVAQRRGVHPEAADPLAPGPVLPQTALDVLGVRAVDQEVRRPAGRVDGADRLGQAWCRRAAGRRSRP